MTSENKKNQLFSLWQSIFDEDEYVVKLFFENIYGCCKNPTVEENGNVLSSAFLIPCEIEDYKGFYVYCALTHTEHRGKGLMAKVLSQADEIAENENKDFLLLVPAEKGLFQYYGKFGYTPYGYGFQTEKPTVYREITKPYSSVREFHGTELKFPNCVTDFWADSVKHYGGKIIEIQNSICLLGDRVLDAKSGIKIHNTAMIKTNIRELKNTSCFIGLTLE